MIINILSGNRLYKYARNRLNKFIVDTYFNDDLNLGSRVDCMKTNIKDVQVSDAWGQYAQRDWELGDREGLAGTSAAIQILCINDSDAEISHEQHYMKKELWDDDRAVYRYSALLNGLAATSQIERGTEGWRFVETLCEGMEDQQWDDFIGGSDTRPLISTCVALYSLANAAVHPISDSDLLGDDSLSDLATNLKQRISDQPGSGRDYFTERHTVEAAYCLLILSRLDDAEDDRSHKENISDIAKTLSKHISQINFLETDPYYIRIYYVEKESNEEKEFDFRYKPFLVDAIAAVALIKSGHIEDNLPFIKRVVNEYESETGENTLFKPNREEFPPISDNLWIAKLFKEYDGVNKTDIDGIKIIKSKITGISYNVLSALVAFMIILFLLYIRIMPPDWLPLVDIISPLLLLGSGYLLNNAFAPQIRKLRPLISDIFSRIGKIVDE